jgi:hypothetical protein
MNKGDVKFVLLTMAGIFAAGYLMNAMRTNSWVSSAISGYDA